MWLHNEILFVYVLRLKKQRGNSIDSCMAMTNIGEPFQIKMQEKFIKIY